MLCRFGPGAKEGHVAIPCAHGVEPVCDEHSHNGHDRLHDLHSLRDHPCVPSLHFLHVCHFFPICFQHVVAAIPQSKPVAFSIALGCLRRSPLESIYWDEQLQFMQQEYLRKLLNVQVKLQRNVTFCTWDWSQSLLQMCPGSASALSARMG